MNGVTRNNQKEFRSSDAGLNIAAAKAKDEKADATLAMNDLREKVRRDCENLLPEIREAVLGCCGSKGRKHILGLFQRRTKGKTVTFDEFKQIMKQVGVKQTKWLKTLFLGFDTKTDGSIKYFSSIEYLPVLDAIWNAPVIEVVELSAYEQEKKKMDERRKRKAQRSAFALEAGVEDPSVNKSAFGKTRSKIQLQASGGPVSLSKSFKKFCKLRGSDGELDFAHFKAALRFCGINVKAMRLQELFNTFDIDNSYTISHDEFLIGVYGDFVLSKHPNLLNPSMLKAYKKCRPVFTNIVTKESASSSTSRKSKQAALKHTVSIDPIEMVKSKISAAVNRSPKIIPPSDFLSLVFRRFINARVKLKGSEQNKLGVTRVTEATFRCVMASIGLVNPIIVSKLFKEQNRKNTNAIDYSTFISKLYPLTSNYGGKAIRDRMRQRAGKRAGGSIVSVEGALAKLRRLIQGGRCRDGAEGMQRVFRDLCRRARLNGTNQEANLDFAHFRAGLHRCGIPLSPELAEIVFRKLDVNNDGSINYSEFMRVIFPPKDISELEDDESWLAEQRRQRALERIKKQRGIENAIQDRNHQLALLAEAEAEARAEEEREAAAKAAAKIASAKATHLWDMPPEEPNEGLLDILREKIIRQTQGGAPGMTYAFKLFIDKSLQPPSESFPEEDDEDDVHADINDRIRSVNKFGHFGPHGISTLPSPNDVDFDQFNKAMRSCGVLLTPVVMHQLFAQNDSDCRGYINFTEFIKSVFGDEIFQSMPESSSWYTAKLEEKSKERRSKKEYIKKLLVDEETALEALRRRVSKNIPRGDHHVDGRKDGDWGPFRVYLHKTNAKGDWLTMDDFKTAMRKAEIYNDKNMERLYRSLENDNGLVSRHDFIACVLGEEGTKLFTADENRRKITAEQLLKEKSILIHRKKKTRQKKPSKYIKMSKTRMVKRKALLYNRRKNKAFLSKTPADSNSLKRRIKNGKRCPSRRSREFKKKIDQMEEEISQTSKHSTVNSMSFVQELENHRNALLTARDAIASEVEYLDKKLRKKHQIKKRGYRKDQRKKNGSTCKRQQNSLSKQVIEEPYIPVVIKTRSRRPMTSHARLQLKSRTGSARYMRPYTSRESRLGSKMEAGRNGTF